MIFVFAGEDSRRSCNAYLALREKRKKEEKDLRVLRDELLTVEELSQALKGQSLFGGTPIVAAERITEFIGKDADAVRDILENMPAETELIVWEDKKPPENSKVWKLLKKKAEKLEIFEHLKNKQLIEWINKEAAKKEGKISARAAELLAEICQGNLWQLSNELDKLVLYAEGKEITPAEINELTPAAEEVNIFATAQALASGDAKNALKQLAVHRARGDDPRHLISLTVREVRNMLGVRDLLDRGSRPQYFEVARDFHIPSLAARELLRTANNSSSAHLKHLFDRLVISLYALNKGRAEPDDVLDNIAFQALEKSPIRNQI